jgi:hypothetical protein
MNRTHQRVEAFTSSTTTRQKSEFSPNRPLKKQLLLRRSLEVTLENIEKIGDRHRKSVT